MSREGWRRRHERRFGNDRGDGRGGGGSVFCRTREQSLVASREGKRERERVELSLESGGSEKELSVKSEVRGKRARPHEKTGEGEKERGGRKTGFEISSHRLAHGYHVSHDEWTWARLTWQNLDTQSFLGA